MYKRNLTTILFLGFHNMDIDGLGFTLTLFILLLIIYIVTICGNLLIIVLVFCSKTLQSPMYVFLSQLSVTDIMLTTDISPNMLHIIIHEQTTISFSGCITQFYFSCLSLATECFLLTIMSYDRYLAICSPLHYSSIMNNAFCFKLIFASWLWGGSLVLMLTLSICQLQFCGANTVTHFFCDLNALVQLSCSDASIVHIESIILGIHVIVLPFLVIVVSYTYIVSTILKISSFSGRLKCFSTCSSHLTVVSIFYGTLIAMYILPNEGQSQILTKILVMLYTVFTPFSNPFIYSLRNTDIKEALRNIVIRKRVTI
ncbi:olfactory receptor-like protein DTMT [Rana temporaria]|uniref:olfactory receptor-like protein DTMT n=1 Tax=Rana temporaria TaxID=8407 RepID=UPI001AADACB4|nr:olfactory receptor-like protein DTMT [Rana temporaria]